MPAAVNRRTIDNLGVDLELMARRISAARVSGETVDPDWLRWQTRYRRLVARAKRGFTRFTEDATRIVEVGRDRTAREGTIASEGLIKSAGIETAFNGAINTEAVENAIGAVSGGPPLRRILDSYGEEAARVIEQELVSGVAEGRGSRQIIRQIRRQLTSDYTWTR